MIVRNYNCRYTNGRKNIFHLNIIEEYRLSVIIRWISTGFQLSLLLKKFDGIIVFGPKMSSFRISSMKRERDWGRQREQKRSIFECGNKTEKCNETISNLGNNNGIYVKNCKWWQYNLKIPGFTFWAKRVSFCNGTNSIDCTIAQFAKLHTFKLCIWKNIPFYCVLSFFFVFYFHWVFCSLNRDNYPGLFQHRTKMVVVAVIRKNCMPDK